VDDVLTWLTHMLIYEANGWLLLAYGLGRLWPAWASLGALLLTLALDRSKERQANQTAAGASGSTWRNSVGS
jgi:hypothetical protein